MQGEPVIHCPLCQWRPGPAAVWQCTRPGCGTVWNTFHTRALCPGCGYQWQNTTCLACDEMSPHEAWYHWPEDDGHAREEQVEQVEETGTGERR